PHISSLGSITTGFIYFVPLPLFVLFYNLRFNISLWKCLLWILPIAASIAYGLFLPVPLQGQLGMYYSFGYATTFIPRTTALATMTYLCYPNVRKAKYGIGI